MHIAKTRPGTLPAIAHTTKQILERVNIVRVATGKPKLKDWRKSKAKLVTMYDRLLDEQTNLGCEQEHPFDPQKQTGP